MNIKFSRHSKHRLKLYNIDEQDVITEIEHYIIENKLLMGKAELVERFKPRLKYKYPLKIVFEKTLNEVTIITAYPLKKGKNENIL